jgi:hypothetical protein
MRGMMATSGMTRQEKMLVEINYDKYSRSYPVWLGAITSHPGL